MKTAVRRIQLFCTARSYEICLTQVVLTNLRVDVPRCSWSPEMYTMSCAQMRLLMPVAEAQVTNMMPDMTR